MIFLLNGEYVMWEVVELSRLHICEVLQISTGKVEAKIDLADAKLSPEFTLNLDDVKGVTADEVREVMKSVYLDCKAEAEVRLAGIKKTREDVLRELRGEESQKDQTQA